MDTTVCQILEFDWSIESAGEGKVARGGRDQIGGSRVVIVLCWSAYSAVIVRLVGQDLSQLNSDRYPMPLGTMWPNVSW